ncbi:aminopeptidase [Mycobacterium sp. SMC-4]|uniref:aminopeptidase n=1 Tax=Mycobacterium sp. SMC-4 TaxID=2857059 RepID=UPI0021B33295|nr:aminopeptidase [Mycobacterium sp. SMC-4]UXA17949.1 aminopeptidase [Mycobacterium sp. SMC-4]
MNLRVLLLVAGVAALLVGVIALLVPVSVSGPDRDIGCGNAIAADLSQARQVDEQNLANLPILDQIIPSRDFVAECESAVSSRRSWSIPVTVIGVVLVAGSFFAGGRTGRAAT